MGCAFLSSHSALGVNPTFFGHNQARSSVLRFTTSSQSLYKGNCSAVVTVETDDAWGAAASVGSDLTVNLSGTGSTIFYSDSSCTNVISSVTVTTGTSTANFYFVANAVGSATITASASGYSGANQAATLSLDPFTWTGGGANATWSTAANWSGGVAPGSSDVARFDDSCSSNCSPVLGANVSIAGLKIFSSYTGTITQGTYTLTIGSSGFSQLGGTFAGGSGSITLNGPMSLKGGSFTSTSGTLTIANNIAGGNSWTVSGSPTFSANGGTINFGLTAGSGTLTITPGSIVYNNVIVTGWGTTTGSGTMTVNGNLTFKGLHSGAPATVTSLAFAVAGNLSAETGGMSTGSTATIALTGNPSGQTISTDALTSALANITIATGSNDVTLSGNIRILRNYIVSSVGQLVTTGSTLNFGVIPNALAATITPGTAVYNNVTFNGQGTFTGSGTMTINGNLTLNGVGGGNQFALNSLALAVAGNVTANTGGMSANSTGTITLTGNPSGQTISTDGTSSTLANIIIAAGANPVTFSGSVTMVGSYTMTSVGTFTTTGSTLIFGNNCISATTVSPGSATYNNVTFQGWSASPTTLSGTMQIAGDLTLKGCNGGAGKSTLNSGTLQVAGNVTATDSGTTTTSTVALTLTGGGTQTITASAGTLPGGNVTINTTGTVSLASAVSWNATGQTTTVQSGTLNMAGYNLTLKSLTMNGGTIQLKGTGATAGTLTINGSAQGTGAYQSGTITN